jgi:4-hydroxy-tetrahydrodipicolinate synthase
LFVPCGNTGEYYSLTDDERVEIVRTTVESVGSATVVAGAGGSTKTVLDLGNRYEAAGANAIMVMHPVHTYMHERGILEYYRRIADKTDLGVVIYVRGADITREILQELAVIDNVVGVKYAVNDVKAFSKAVSTVSEEVVWLNGLAERFAPSFALEGAEGFTTGIGNFVPEQTLALMEAIRNRDWARARELRDLIRPYEDLREEPGEDNTLSAANNVPAVKYGMELAGMYGGPVREPLVRLSESDKQRARDYFDEFRSASA